MGRWLRGGAGWSWVGRAHSLGRSAIGREQVQCRRFSIAIRRDLAALEEGLADPQSMDHDELTRAVEAADRAGSIVTEHVRSIIDAAQAKAVEAKFR